MNTIKYAIVATALIIGIFSQVVNGFNITVNVNGTDYDMSIPNVCVDYSDNYLDHAEVTVQKSCKHWRSIADYFMQRSYVVTLDGETGVFMRGPPIVEDTGTEDSSSSNNQRSEAGREILEENKNPSNNLTYEEFEKKYCAPTTLLLCRAPSEPEEPQVDSNR